MADRKAHTIRLSAEEKRQIAQVQKLHHLPGMAAVVRFLVAKELRELEK